MQKLTGCKNGDGLSCRNGSFLVTDIDPTGEGTTVAGSLEICQLGT